MEVLSGVELWAAQEKFAVRVSMAVVVAMLITVLESTTSAGCCSRWWMWWRNSSRGAVAFLERGQVLLTLSDKLSQCNFVSGSGGKGRRVRSSGHCIRITKIGGKGDDSWCMEDDHCNDVVEIAGSSGWMCVNEVLDSFGASIIVKQRLREVGSPLKLRSRLPGCA